MNYSEFNFNNNYNINPELIKLSSNDAESILNDFKVLNNSLDEYKNKIEKLEENKIYFDNYISNCLNLHMNIMNIINNYDIQSNKIEMNEIFNDYNIKIKNEYNLWINNYYSIKLIEYENIINMIEKKIADFRKLFIYIINKISKPIEEAIKLCPICFENEVDICLSPCGHTLCNKCVISHRSRYNNDKCYSCRTIINEYIRLYFSL